MARRGGLTDTVTGSDETFALAKEPKCSGSWSASVRVRKHVVINTARGTQQSPAHGRYGVFGTHCVIEAFFQMRTTAQKARNKSTHTERVRYCQAARTVNDTSWMRGSHSSYSDYLKRELRQEERKEHPELLTPA
ncbi:hypothetical protein QR685DRAFT_94813 [Neurospora intermedia]|uniref:Uncharacterized protein n=1 Tax=Neurospora intermedia TaxID=5142 RepID=A0ABR3D2Q5_NEUIN